MATRINPAYPNKYYPGSIDSLSVTISGSQMHVCHRHSPHSTLIDGFSGMAHTRLTDSSMRNACPRQVKLSPLGTLAVTRCSNECPPAGEERRPHDEPVVDWDQLCNDYVWDIQKNRVTHFFNNNRYVVFSADDSILVAVSCSYRSSTDMACQSYSARCYWTKSPSPTIVAGDTKDAQMDEEDVQRLSEERKVILPDCDIVTEPVVISSPRRLALLLQPCMRRFGPPDSSHSLRIQNIILVTVNLDIDMVMAAAFNKRQHTVRSLLGGRPRSATEKQFFLDMKPPVVSLGENNGEGASRLLLVYGRSDRLPPYRCDGLLNLSANPMEKGLLHFDLATGSVLHHVRTFADPSTDLRCTLFSSRWSTALDIAARALYSTGVHRRDAEFDPNRGVGGDSKSNDGCELARLSLSFEPANRMACWALLLEGAYAAVLAATLDRLYIIHTRSGDTLSAVPLHTKATTGLLRGADDRTVRVGCAEGHVLSFTLSIGPGDHIAKVV